MRVLIKYHDGSGQITEREISDLRKENESNIDAFCHTREERRTFNLDRILHAVSPDTGELLNPYQLVPLMRDSESLDTLTWKSRQAIKALKFFSLTTRGFAKRERKHIDAFVKSLVNTSSHTDEDISEWVYCLWCADLYDYRNGNVQEYKGLLEQIPNSLLDECRAFAVRIVMGSARQPENLDWMQRIDEEFCPRPVVRKPLRPY
ncbi:hypothetical protein [Pseudomonas sp. 10S4]|uniref:hypothetical protein n=1 Tax=Pseudomonas sp. 10S4 TaxID=3048583 RepID=UPI002AC99096|nr:MULTISPECIES: hypothetical protein [unclassified Pseudomonas]MEB0222898.1 hypothetical protein [Pseudomonas sp. 5S1]MEB0293057.1 hypothetical protein [Pseudomonas sp. 10S4]WPX17200.1 hypothetical protein RHM58_25265 [Pseudomonas sp. 10S4]